MSVAAEMAEDMMSFYNGNELGQTPGLLPLPYYCKCWVHSTSAVFAPLTTLKGGREVL